VRNGDRVIMLGVLSKLRLPLLLLLLLLPLLLLPPPLLLLLLPLPLLLSLIKRSNHHSLPGPPEAAGGQGDTFVLVRTCSGGVGYINTRSLRSPHSPRST
jgi:hypothetical protein